MGRTVFWPAPHVDSGLVAFTRHEPPAADRAATFAVVDAAFAQRRKTLRAALAGWAGSPQRAEERLLAAGLDPGARGEQLDVTAFARLAATGPAGDRARASGLGRPGPRNARAAGVVGRGGCREETGRLVRGAAGAAAGMLVGRAPSAGPARGWEERAVAAVGGTTETTQMYLRTVLELERAGVPALRARLRDRLQHSAPAISQTVERLVREGLLALRETDRVLVLTEPGRLVAEAVLRKHELAEHLLVQLAGLAPEDAHEQACDWEHVISDDVEDRLRRRLGQPGSCPFTAADAAARPGGAPLEGVGAATSEP